MRKEESWRNATSQVIIGNGSSVIKQYPEVGETIISNQNVFILTDGSKSPCRYEGLDKEGYHHFWELTHIEVEMSNAGTGR